jgi:predicted AAA+ superfamily ATPase
MLDRYLRHKMTVAREAYPALFIWGPRQCGKTTVAREFASHYVSLDDPLAAAEARQYPLDFLRSQSRPVVLDEVQRAPELFLPLKLILDEEQKRGDFVLTGSSNYLHHNLVRDSLIGRLGLIRLYPLSEVEIRQQGPYSFLDWVLAGELQPCRVEPLTVEPLARQLARGGFPVPALRLREEELTDWFRTYLQLYVEKDLRDLAPHARWDRPMMVLKALAPRLSSTLNIADIARDLAMPQSSVQRDLALWTHLFLLDELPAWSSNLSKRLVKSPKLYLADTGFAAHLLQVNAEGIAAQPRLFGRLLENHVYNELCKQAGWSKQQGYLYHFRTSQGVEVDFVFQSLAGAVVGVEVKATRAPASEDFSGLKVLAQEAGEAFACGIVLYLGAEVRQISERLWCVPLNLLYGNRV